MMTIETTKQVKYFEALYNDSLIQMHVNNTNEFRNFKQMLKKFDINSGVIYVLYDDGSFDGERITSGKRIHI